MNIDLLTKKARQHVEKSALTCFKTHGGQQIPVPVVSVAQQLGISVVETSFASAQTIQEPYSVLTHDDGGWVILVDVQLSADQKRVTIARQLGYFVLTQPSKQESFVDSNSTEDDIETDKSQSLSGTKTPQSHLQKLEAELFALCLLVPEDILKERWSIDPDISGVAEYFSVSKETLVDRLEQLNLNTI